MANILVLYAHSAKVIGVVNDHLEAFNKYSAHNIVQVDSRLIDFVDIDFEQFDCIVFHYSIVISMTGYVSQSLFQKAQSFTGLKILFIQDEMRWVEKTCAAIQNLKITTIFTVVNEEVIRKIYRDSWFDNVRFVPTLTGFVSEDLIKRKTKPYKKRAIDVSYRARKLPAWCGALGQEKWIIGEKFKNDAKAYGLKCDISSSEGDRIYGEKWLQFVENSKSMLGVESGSSFIDFSGEIAPLVDAYEAQNHTAPFEDVRDKFLEGRDGEIKINVISPRCFEAAALRTLMIMYDGSYSGILIPNRHFVLLNKDHSNMSDVVEVIRNPDKAKKIIDNAYNEIACSEKYTHKNFIMQFDNVVTEELDKVNHVCRPHVDACGVYELVEAGNKQYIFERRKAFIYNVFFKASMKFVRPIIYNCLPVSMRIKVLNMFGRLRRKIEKILL